MYIANNNIIISFLTLTGPLSQICDINYLMLWTVHKCYINYILETASYINHNQLVILSKVVIAKYKKVV